MGLQDNETIDYKKTIFNTFNKKFKKILAIEYHYDLIDIFKCIQDKSIEEKNTIYEEMINSCLNKLTNIDHETMEKNNKSYDEICDFFEYAYFTSDEYEQANYYSIEEEAEAVVTDLINKIHGINNRGINLPIKLNVIKDFEIHNTIEEIDVEKVIFWIILKLATMCYVNR